MGLLSLEQSVERFDFLRGAKEGCLFRGDLVWVAKEIRGIYKDLGVDYRQLLCRPDMRDYGWKLTEHFRIGYYCLKYATAKVIQPVSICEIGVDSGLGALAFLEACPSALYVGIDNLSEDETCGTRAVNRTESILKERGYNSRILTCDSQKLSKLPEPYTFDLVHVDGCHLYEGVLHDAQLAWESDSKWILFDDARDSTVVAAIFEFIRRVNAGATDWAYFEDTWTGSILVCREHSRP